MYVLTILFKILFIYFRGEGREKEGNIYVQSVASRMLPTGDPACNPGRSPD